MTNQRPCRQRTRQNIWRGVVTVVLICATVVGGELQSHASTFVVNSLADSHDTNPGDGFAEDDNGNTTLRAAVEESNANSGADTITFNTSALITPPSTSAVIYLWEGQLNVTDTLTITGPNNQIIIDGTNNRDWFGSGDFERALNVDGASLTMSGMTFRSFWAPGSQDGGLIYNSGTLDCDDCEFSWGYAEYGGLIYTQGTAVFLMCSFSSASANLGGGLVCAADGQTDFESCSFEDGDSNVDGGALVVLSGAEVELSNSYLIDNFATAYGGAIANHGTLELYTVDVLYNDATLGGGGIANVGSLYIDTCEIAYNNVADENGHGGGILGGFSGTGSIHDNYPDDVY